MTSPRTTYAVIFFSALAWCSAILLAPYLAASSSPFAAFFYRAFHPICHQLPERSFHLFDEKLAVCSRCSSIYFASFVATIAYPIITPTLQHSNTPRSLLLAALLPMLINVGLDFLGIHASTFTTRTITGAVFGFVLPFFVLPAAIEGVQQLVTQKQITIVEHQKGIFHA
jgi:uncharacterized membrane protein